jgi:7-cyano-7-deazaguanine reductase
MSVDRPEIKGGGVLGQQVRDPRRQLDTFQLPESSSEVTYTSDEVTSLCPVTGQPDWYEVEIGLFDSENGIESKSLKLYLQSFRDDGQFCEAFADTICQDVKRATEASTVEVTVTQKPRGGVSIEAVSTA